MCERDGEEVAGRKRDTIARRVSLSDLYCFALCSNSQNVKYICGAHTEGDRLALSKFLIA